VALAADPPSDSLPPLDKNSAKGLEFYCTLAKTNFVVGEPVNIWCAVTNTTDSTKPHPFVGSHYCLVRGETNRTGGLLPRVLPQLKEAIKIKSAGWANEQILYIPPHASVMLLLTYKSGRPEQFKGRVVYDPIMHGGWGTEDDKQACAFSNTFEYEVMGKDRK